MKRMTLGYAALVSAALVTVSGLTATAAPQSAADSSATLDRTGTLSLAASQTGMVSSALGLSSQEQLVVKDVVTDPDGTRHFRYDRTFDGLRVVGGDLVVHQTKAGDLASVDRATEAKLDVSTKPAIAAPDATTSVLAAETGAQWSKAEPQLVVFAIDQAPTLAWEVVLTGIKADQSPSELHVYTDATTGKVLMSEDRVMHVEGTGVSQYSGTVKLQTTLSGSTYQLKDPLRGNQTVNNSANGTGTGTLFTDADNKWGNGAISDKATAGVDAAYGAAATWDYYKNVHGRSGIKNNGVGAMSRVHYGNAYNNANWSDSCFCMTYGDGVGNAKPLTELDVAGHEMSHGVTSATGNMVYSGEPGGLNEATSDIFGTTVEFNAANTSDVGDYLIGEKIDIRGTGAPLRYMDKPSKDGKSADYWSSTVGSLDVHYSSGIANHFFYLLSEGSGAKTINGVAYNSPTYDGAAVTGITRAKAEKIWYRALTTKFTSSTKYAAARTGTLAAASELYGASSAEYAAVNRAWAAVNVK
ncbi:M4 family metallopeptidase [Umezawaea sp. Da 62-37]|uniref:M4 family metallopeptidase n=1 Tax=Umezawaea sp. Da 62-37 TaxID=3075927 RepID=UPI0028F6EF9A|nr:M4 family metallopeptidase [Umezawaea sp. Da 62-37]WNV86508.1 M4 family metallopeptidase [Umezawaea sp. Da 62-37]